MQTKPTTRAMNLEIFGLVIITNHRKTNKKPPPLIGWGFFYGLVLYALAPSKYCKKGGEFKSVRGIKKRARNANV